MIDIFIISTHHTNSFHKSWNWPETLTLHLFVNVNHSLQLHWTLICDIPTHPPSPLVLPPSQVHSIIDSHYYPTQKNTKVLIHDNISLYDSRPMCHEGGLWRLPPVYGMMSLTTNPSAWKALRMTACNKYHKICCICYTWVIKTFLSVEGLYIILYIIITFAYAASVLLLKYLTTTELLKMKLAHNGN